MLDSRLYTVTFLLINVAWLTSISPGDINININQQDQVQKSGVQKDLLGATDDIGYLGCHPVPGPRILEVLAYANQHNTIETCKAACGAKGFQFAGVEFR